MIRITEVPSIDNDTLDVCQRKGLTPYIVPINNMIWKIYRGVNYVNLEKVEDTEIPEYEKLCFEIHVTSEPDHVLDDEDAFFDFFFSRIPQDIRDFFVFIYQVS